jgi:hypothetical protein
MLVAIQELFFIVRPFHRVELDDCKKSEHAALATVDQPVI